MNSRSRFAPAFFRSAGRRRA